MTQKNSKRPICPDCGRPLRKKRKGTVQKLYCGNPTCPVICVTFERGSHHGIITRITRAAQREEEQQ